MWEPCAVSRDWSADRRRATAQRGRPRPGSDGPDGLRLLPAAIALGEDRARSLGHLASEGFLVSRSGSLARHREVLGAEHVIGWTVRDTWFQRRSGLVTLEATTAGGSQRVQVLDVPEHDGLVLAAALTPDLLAEVGYRTPPSQ